VRTDIAKRTHPFCSVCEVARRSHHDQRCCCKQMPGICHPDNFNKPLKRYVRLALLSGNYSIDWWEDDPSIYYVRPATKEKRGCFKDPSWGGECCFLTGSGCSLPYGERPHGCVSLMPISITECIGDGKYASALYWKDHQLILTELLDELKERIDR